jgi:hypothetical protein
MSTSKIDTTKMWILTKYVDNLLNIKKKRLKTTAKDLSFILFLQVSQNSIFWGDLPKGELITTGL